MTNGQSPQEVGELIDALPLSAARSAIVVLCALAVLLDGFAIQTLALAVPTLAGAWGLAPSAFSLALSGSVIGMLAGTALVAPLGDRYGRRPVLIAGMLLVGVASVATILAADPAGLVVWRFLTGIGIGMSLPNATALTSEYVPKRSRAFLITLMYISIALGALIAGFIAPALLARSGWHALFVVGGVLAILLSLVLLLRLPESIRFLLGTRAGDPAIGHIVRRVLPGIDANTLTLAAAEQVKQRNVMTLLTPEFRGRTLLLWAVFALNLFVLFVLISWLPTLLTDAGWTRPQALRGAVLIQAGGILGALMIARQVDLGRTIAALVVAYCVVAAALAAFLLVPATLGNWSLILLVVGAGVSGSQAALTALSAIFYPALIRATGAGWASAAGRAGAALAPIVGGLVLGAAALSPAAHLALLIPPVLLCAGCVLLLRFTWRDNRDS